MCVCVIALVLNCESLVVKSKDLQGVRRMMATMISRQITEMTAEAMLRLFQCFSLSMPSSRSCCVVCVCKGNEK